MSDITTISGRLFLGPTPGSGKFVSSGVMHAVLPPAKFRNEAEAVQHFLCMRDIVAGYIWASDTLRWTTIKEDVDCPECLEWIHA